jgi:hypothetical protein
MRYLLLLSSPLALALPAQNAPHHNKKANNEPNMIYAIAGQTMEFEYEKTEKADRWLHDHPSRMIRR